MTRNALFVDLSNFYTQIIKHQENDSENWRSYFTEWFDFSLLSKRITGNFSDVWVFHSDKLGPKEAKITDKHLNELVSKFNNQKGVTVRNVNIKGEQREHFKVACEKCGHQTEADWKSEKGVDSSLIVHLFDTMDSWDVAYLLSGDADYVPAVSSLRRQGKIVKGAGFPKRTSSALIRECFEYVDLFNEFIADDFFIYRFCKKNGILWNYVNDVFPKESGNKDDIRVILERIEGEKTKNFIVRLLSTENRNLKSWRQEITFHTYSVKSRIGWLRNEIGQYHSFEFDSFFGPIVKDRLQYLLLETDFSGGQESKDFFGNSHFKTDLVFRWNEIKNKYETFYIEEIRTMEKRKI
jgi:uncharacterized LabA/DUF88 family protein